MLAEEEDRDLWYGHQELILAIDDEPTVCEIVKDTLETHNYRVSIAHNGVEAVELYAKHKEEIHCVLMDMMMPSMDGLATISQLRQLNPNIYAIAMSGLNSTDAVDRALRSGFQKFLPKPFAKKELLSVLRS
ncbi:MAG: response regulator [Pseudanabaena sp. RU_4_16]|nr:response regulator [Pseudanabaena sp. RU_4_16]